MPYILAVSSASDAITQFITVFKTVWSFIIDNWYFATLIIVPIAGMVISHILGILRSH